MDDAKPPLFASEADATAYATARNKYFGQKGDNRFAFPHELDDGTWAVEDRQEKMSFWDRVLNVLFS